ncbi:MAG TPA: SAM-dependent methyltransferase [Methylobacter sp.]
MTVMRNVTGTAFVVAEFRDEENREAHALYHDPIVHLFLDQDSKQAADRIFASFPAIKKMVRIRTRYLDDRLDHQLQLGYCQVVILGAGLDTRAERKAAPNVAYFEIDDGKIQAFKKARLDENRVEARVRFIPGNYVTDGLVYLLERNEFDFGLPAHFIWEGNTMYLTADAVGRVLTDITRHLKQCSISFDYMAEEVIAKTTGDHEITNVVERFSAMGAPWIYGVNDLEKLASACGMAIMESLKMADLHGAYWPDIQLDSPIYYYYSICTLQSLNH